MISWADTAGLGGQGGLSELAQLAGLAGAILLLLGATFTLIAAVGLFRFKDIFGRMHAATKPQLLGLILICGGITLTLRTWQWTLVCLLVVGIQMLAAPVGSHLLGRTAYRTGLVQQCSLVVDELDQDTAASHATVPQREPGETHESSSQ